MGLLIKIIKHPKKAFRALIYRLLSHRPLSSFGHSDFQRFIVLSRSRTGSNMLISFLNSHPNVHTEVGIFGNLNGRSYKDILAKVFGKQPYYIKSKGFKIFYYHPQDDDSGDLWDSLVNMDGLCVIHLKRRNILRVLISRKIAGYEDVWESTSTKGLDARRNKAVTFTVDELEEGFKQTRDWENGGDEKFREHPLLSIYYESLVNDPEGAFSKITDFLGVRYVPPETKLRRQNPERLRNIVINYDELKLAFTGTEWQTFFDE